MINTFNYCYILSFMLMIFALSVGNFSLIYFLCIRMIFISLIIDASIWDALSFDNLLRYFLYFFDIRAIALIRCILLAYIYNTYTCEMLRCFDYNSHYYHFRYWWILSLYVHLDISKFLYEASLHYCFWCWFACALLMMMPNGQ